MALRAIYFQAILLRDPVCIEKFRNNLALLFGEGYLCLPYVCLKIRDEETQTRDLLCMRPSLLQGNQHTLCFVCGKNPWELYGKELSGPVGKVGKGPTS